MPSDHSELNYFISNEFDVIKRSKVLGLIISEKKGIAVAGTHGKTTVSSMIAHIFSHSDYGCNAFLGGILVESNTNLLVNNKSNYVIVEADEFDRSFLQLSPFFGVITSMDADHLDIYETKENLQESFHQFACQVVNGGKILVKKNIVDQIECKNVLKYTYSISEKADFYIRNIEIENGNYIIALATPFGIVKDIVIGVPGKINVENAVAAMAVAIIEGIESDQIKEAIKSFAGVKRRFEYVIKTKELVFIDDYAHHPEELKAFINSVRELYPDKKITGVFQPHLYSRTKDFAKEFGKSLSLLDELILLDIYPAREFPIKGVSSALIFNEVTLSDKTLTSKEDFWKIIENKDFEIIVTLGAGDIDKMVPQLKEYLLK